MNDNILEIKDLIIHYFTDTEIVKAVNGISFELKKGETIGIVGETGAGKTTMALGIMGLVPSPPGKIVGGKIIFDGEDILKKSKKEMRKIRGSKISMIFQDPMTSLNPVITVGEQIVEVIRLHEKISYAEAMIKAQRMLELVGIPGKRHNEYPNQFSGGMRQRVIIAIALACNPTLLIADEPTTALDVTIQAQVLDLMNNLKIKLNTSMILISHDLGIVAEICDMVAVMYAGEIVEYGTLEDIYNDMKHPYTKGLFGSIPHLDLNTDRLKAIEGLMPDPSNLPSGCNFYPRCLYKTDICETIHPSNIQLKPRHSVRCHLYNSINTEV